MYIIFFLFMLKNIACGYSLEPPRRGVPTINVLSRNMKNIRISYLKTFIFFIVKFLVYLNRHVFVMCFGKAMPCDISLLPLSDPQRKKTFEHRRPVKIQINLRIRTVWSEFSPTAFWIAKNAKFLHVDNEVWSYCAQIRRLIWVFVGHTCQKVCFSWEASFLFPRYLGNHSFHQTLIFWVLFLVLSEPQRKKMYLMGRVLRRLGSAQSMFDQYFHLHHENRPM